MLEINGKKTLKELKCKLDQAFKILKYAKYTLN
jgi:hypothetical protein